METTTIIIGGLAVVAAVLVGVLLMGAARGRRRFEDVPPAMRPGYSDDQLEKSVIESYMAWGVILTVFLAIFLPVYWLMEAGRQTAAREDQFVTQVVRGGELYTENCAQCHGGDGSGGATASPYSDASWPAPNLRDIVARYESNAGVDDIERFIEQTLHQGRPGTPMPAWGTGFRGPLTDEQIESITMWILDNQDDVDLADADPATNMSGGELYAENCARCHGDNLEGRDAIRAPRLADVFERHDSETILGILRNGIIVPTGAVMPGWQDSFQTQPFTDDALERIIEFLAESQEEGIDPDAVDAEDEADDDEADEADEADEDAADDPTDDPTEA